MQLPTLAESQSGNASCIAVFTVTHCLQCSVSTGVTLFTCEAQLQVVYKARYNLPFSFRYVV